jgi:hypothetical protein
MQGARPTGLPASWPEILGKVEAAVREAQAAAAVREEAAARAMQSAPADLGGPVWHQSQQRLQACLDGLEACAARATQSAEPAAVVIDAGVDVVRRWQAGCLALGQKLATGAAGDV